MNMQVVFLCELKVFLTDASILAQLESRVEYTMFTNESQNMIGCTLKQKGKVVAYASCQLKPY